MPVETALQSNRPPLGTNGQFPVNGGALPQILRSAQVLYAVVIISNRGTLPQILRSAQGFALYRLGTHGCRALAYSIGLNILQRYARNADRFGSLGGRFPPPVLAHTNASITLGSRQANDSAK